jgi:hypothetical protein
VRVVLQAAHQVEFRMKGLPRNAADRLRQGHDIERICRV